MGLQHKIEDLDRVERAFVHIDYQERPYDEHDENSWPNEWVDKGIDDDCVAMEALVGTMRKLEDPHGRSRLNAAL